MCLGAEHASESVFAAEDAMAVGPVTVLEVADPRLERRRCVQWDLPLRRAWIGAGGRYEGEVEENTPTALGRRATVRFGNAHIRMHDDPAGLAPRQVRRFDLDPRLIQVWMVDRGGGIKRCLWLSSRRAIFARI